MAQDSRPGAPQSSGLGPPPFLRARGRPPPPALLCSALPGSSLLRRAAAAGVRAVPGAAAQDRAAEVPPGRPARRLGPGAGALDGPEGARPLAAGDAHLAAAPLPAQQPRRRRLEIGRAGTPAGADGTPRHAAAAAQAGREAPGRAKAQNGSIKLPAGPDPGVAPAGRGGGGGGADPGTAPPGPRSGPRRAEARGRRPGQLALPEDVGAAKGCGEASNTPPAYPPPPASSVSPSPGNGIPTVEGALGVGWGPTKPPPACQGSLICPEQVADPSLSRACFGGRSWA